MKLPALVPEQKVAVAGAVLTLVGAALPWLTAESGSVLGFLTEGFLTGMAALSVLGIVVLWEWRRVQMVSVAMFGAIVVALAIQFLFSMDRIAGSAAGAVNAGIGAYLTVIAGVLIGGSGVYGLVERHRAVSEADGATGESNEETPRGE